MALRITERISSNSGDRQAVDGKTGVPVNFAQRPLWLLNGVDRAGNDFTVGHRAR